MVAKKNVTTPASAVTAAPVPVTPSAPVKEGKEKATKTTESKAAAPAAPAKAAPAPAVKAAAAPAVVASPVTTVSAVVPVAESPAEVENPLDAVFAKLTAAVSLFKEIQANLKVLQKTYDKMKKVVDKQERKKISARTTPSGFAKPTKISDELCAFLSVPKGTMMSRTEVTRNLNKYIKEHNLYEPSNRRIIVPDANLKKILTLQAGEQLSFFTLQRAIKSHFQSAVKA